MENKILFYLNEERIEVSGPDILMPLAEFLRKKKNLAGTKIVCAEGDCGACTVLIVSQAALAASSGSSGSNEEDRHFQAINSCIYPVYLCHASCVITIEGVASGPHLHPVQEALLENHGTQCGYCTPGFVMSLLGMTEDFRGDQAKSESGIAESTKAQQSKAKKIKPEAINAEKVQKYLTGNLCRCTGYDSIIKAGTKITLGSCPSLANRYLTESRISELRRIGTQSVVIEESNFKVYIPSSVQELLLIKAADPEVRIVSGCTDLGVMINKGRYPFQKFMSLQGVKELYSHAYEKDFIRLGCQTTITQFEKMIESFFPELAQFLTLFAALQIKNIATVVGNIANASPVGDLIPFMLINEAILVLGSDKGNRSVNINDFYLGYKQIDLNPTEIILELLIPRPEKISRDKPHSFLKLYKVSGRNDLDISTVSFAGMIQIKNKIISNAKICFGGVSAVPARLKSVEEFLLGKPFEEQTFLQAAHLALEIVKPISDVRGSADYRKILVKNLLMKFYFEVSSDLKLKKDLSVEKESLI